MAFLFATKHALQRVFSVSASPASSSLVAGFGGLLLSPSSSQSSSLIVSRLFSESAGDRFSLNSLQPVDGSAKERLRVGRGIGSGKGKTCGRGHKGQKSRQGSRKPALGFEGGQTPLHRRFPKHGFKNFFRLEYQPLNISSLKSIIESGRIDATSPINLRTLVTAGFFKKIEFPGVKLLASGKEDFNIPVQIEVSKASKSAIEAIERAGGTIVTKYYNKLNLRKLTNGSMSFADLYSFTEESPSSSTDSASSETTTASTDSPLSASTTKIPGLVDVLPPRSLIPYYESKENRGYLSNVSEKLTEKLRLIRD